MQGAYREKKDQSEGHKWLHFLKDYKLTEHFKWRHEDHSIGGRQQWNKLSHHMVNVTCSSQGRWHHSFKGTMEWGFNYQTLIKCYIFLHCKYFQDTVSSMVDLSIKCPSYNNTIHGLKGQKWEYFIEGKDGPTCRKSD